MILEEHGGSEALDAVEKHLAAMHDFRNASCPPDMSDVLLPASSPELAAKLAHTESVMTQADANGCLW